MHNHTDHEPKRHTIERYCDAVVVGGSAAGLAGALQIARQNRSVIVVDAGEPRNAPAAHMHGFLGHDGKPPSELTAIGREEVRSYGGEVLDGRVESLTKMDDGRFRAELVGGNAVIARRVLAATGLTDVLPEIEGVAEHWGSGVIHCPFCHGYEVRDQRVVQIVTHPMGLHSASLWRQLSANLTIIIHDLDGVDQSQLDALWAGGVTILEGHVDGIVTDTDGEVAGVKMADGASIDADVVVVGPQFKANAEPFVDLGLEATPHMSGAGDSIETDPAGLTSVEGLYAAGNLTDPSQQVLNAAANGSWVGAMISFSLAAEDLSNATRLSAQEDEWDQRYTGDQIWRGNPNGTLVNEISGMIPGRAIDVGAGEGGDAIWLAEQGWAVTASDITERGLDQVAAEAGRRGLTIDCHHADANASDPFEPAAFDLVTAHYASIPRTGDGRGIRNLIDAVAPGGTLLIVGHDLEPMRQQIDTKVHSRGWDPDAYVRSDDIAAVLADMPEWTIEVNETRPRPAGAASGGHHVDDMVLRAKREIS